MEAIKKLEMDCVKEIGNFNDVITDRLAPELPPKPKMVDLQSCRPKQQSRSTGSETFDADEAEHVENSVTRRRLATSTLQPTPTVALVGPSTGTIITIGGILLTSLVFFFIGRRF